MVVVAADGKGMLAEVKQEEVKQHEGRRFVLLGFEEAIKVAEMQVAMQRSVVNRIEVLAFCSKPNARLNWKRQPLTCSSICSRTTLLED